MKAIFNPFTGNFDFIDSGGTYFLDPVATETDLPLTDADGAARIVRSTDRIYVWDASTSKWFDSGISSAAIGSAPNANGFSIANITSGNITKPTFNLQPADATNPGILTTGAQTISGDKTLSGTINLSTLTASRALTTDVSKNIAVSATTSTELGYVNGVTSAIQTQLNNKQPLDATLTALAAYNTNGILTQTAADTFAGRTLTPGSSKISISNGDGVSGNPTLDITEANLSLNNIGGAPLNIAHGGTNSIAALNNNRIIQSSGGAIVEAGAITASRALISDSNGIPTQSSVTSTTLAFLDATSSVQTQINAKQPLDSTLTSLAAYNTNGILTQTAADTFTGRTLTPGSSKVSISNGDGVSGNPTIDVTTFSAGDIFETSFSGANNQSSAANVTGLSFANATVRAFEVLASVTVIATANLYEEFTIKGIQRASDWQITNSSVGDDSGIAFSITNAGQVQYISSNNSGFTSLTMKFRALTVGV